MHRFPQVHPQDVISALFNVGTKTEQILATMGVRTVGDALNITTSEMQANITGITAEDLGVVANGWQPLIKRAENVVDRVRGAVIRFADIAPEEFMCLICYNWLIDPVTFPDTPAMVCRACALRCIVGNGQNPFNREAAVKSDLRDVPGVWAMIRAHRDFQLDVDRKIVRE